MRTNTFIRKLREQLGYTQEEFAKILGTRQVSISSWERGRCKPMTPNALKIIKLAGKHSIKVTLEDLLIN